MKVAFCGYDFFYSCLKRILEMENIEVIKIFTYETDNQYNYNHYIIQLAEDHDIPYTLKKITRDDVRELFEEQKCDCIIAAAYPYKIPVDVCEGFRGINVHPTLLPIGRGCWPLPWIILKNLKESGVTIHKLNKNFDEGDIILQESFKVGEREDLESLSCKSQLLAERLIVQVLSDFDQMWNRAVPQGEGEYWEYPTEKDMSFDFNMEVKQIDRIIRAYGKFDSCVSFLGKSWLVWDANCWEECHDYEPGTIVHVTNKEYLIAAKDGYVCLRFFGEEK